MDLQRFLEDVARRGHRQAVNVVALSITEGEDKPLKYPTMFAKADLVLLTKVDLLVHLANTRLDAIEKAITRVMPDPQIIWVSSQDGFGIADWVDWLKDSRATVLEPAVSAKDAE